jgi:hypothetical protein
MRVGRSLAFPATPLAVGLSPDRTFEVLTCIPRRPITRSSAPSWSLRVLFEAVHSALADESAASPGILDAPPSTSLRASSHARVAARVACRCRRQACSVLVVSHHLDGFLRSKVAGLLHPAADPGVRRVSREVVIGARAFEPAFTFLATRIAPFKESPSLIAELRRRSHLPSCRCARDLGVQAPRETLLTGRALRSTEVDLHASRRRHRSAEQLNQQAQDRCGHPVAAVPARLLRCRSRRWRSLGEQSASGLCSTSESVPPRCRCQRRVGLSFHGLCSPSRSFWAVLTRVRGPRCGSRPESQLPRASMWTAVRPMRPARGWPGSRHRGGVHRSRTA